MRTMISEYGKFILAIAIALIVIPFVIMIVQTQFDTAIEEPENINMEVYMQDSATYDPVMVVNNGLNFININKDDKNYDAKAYSSNKESSTYKQIYANYQNFATCYENSFDKSPLKAEVVGIDNVKIAVKGKYDLIYRVVNSKGRSFQKNISVIVN